MRADLSMGGHRVRNAVDAIEASDLTTLGQVEDLLGGVASGGSIVTVPVGGVLDYAGTTAPSGFLLCYGQAVNRITYAALFAVIGTAFGAGDGTNTFNLPDARGRVSAGKDDMGGAAASRLTTPVNGATLGATGGVQSEALTTAQMPAHSHAASTATAGAHTHEVQEGQIPGGLSGTLSSGDDFTSTAAFTSTTSSDGDHTHTVTVEQTGDGTAHSLVQPTIVFNKIIRTGVS